MTVRKATLINASGKYLKVILTVLVNAILARILTPFDFGVVVVITVFSTFFATLSDMGLGPAIVQKKDLSRSDIDNLFTCSVYVAAGLSLIFMLCAFPIAAFYKDSVYLKPTFLLAVSLFFNALNMVPNGMLNRDKKFVTIAVRTVVVYVVSAVLHPILSDYQDEPRAIYSRYMRLVRFLWCLGIFVAGFAFLAADEIIGILYGAGPFLKELVPEMAMTAVMAAAVLLCPFSVEGLVPSLLAKTGYLLVIFAVMMLVSREYRLFKIK